MEIKPKKINIVSASDLAKEEIPVVSPKSINLVVNVENILEHCDPISNIDKLKEKLIKLGILFNTDPKVYQKKDYWLLICILYQALTHLYESDPESIITTKWIDPHSDSRIPSEKLVKETIDLIIIPENVSAFNNDAGYITGETDPTVPSWAKENDKPTYTASEVGALPSNTFIPSKTSDLTNDSGFLTSHQDISGKADKIPVIDETQDLSTSFTIDPNKMYMFGTRTSLTITLATPSDNTIVNEYMFLFTSGSTATTLIVPNTVVWLKDPDIQPNKKYAVSIENNLGIIGEWNNE